MNHKNSLLKNHISALDTKTLQNVCKERFGVSLEDVEAVLSGDVNKAKQIGEFGRQGRFASKYAPKVAQSVIDGIEGTLALNEATSKILQTAGKADTKIRKDGYKTLLANQRYNHDKEEIAKEYDSSRQLENLRHEYATNYLEIRSLYDRHFLSVDEDARLAEQAYRPELKQIQEADRQNERLMDHVLQYGDKSHSEYLVSKDYLDTDFREVGGVLQTIKGFLSSAKSAIGL